MAVDPEWLRKLQEQALAGAQQNPVQNFNPQMLAANAPIPNPNMGGGLGGLLRRGAIGFQNGLGRLQQAMFPIDPTAAAGMSAEEIKTARNQAMMRMGLGMMSAANQGARGGEALAHGFGLAQGGMTDDMQLRMQNARVARQEERQTTRDEIEDQRYAEQFAYQQQQDRTRQEMERQQQEESRRRFEQSLELDRRGLGLREREVNMTAGLGRIPAGYQMRPDGTGLEPVPGGPADMSGSAGRKASQALRKEFRSLQTVKDYETALPLIQSAATAPDNGYGDLQLIYSVGKVLDPGSVVREGELALTMAAGSPLQQIIGSTRFTTEQGGRLTPQQRQQIMGMLQERISAYKQAYERDFNQYAEYAQEAGFDPTMVVGTHAETAYAKPPQARKRIGEKEFILIDGQWYEAD